MSKLNYSKVGLVGIGGVGKTQLAVEFAYRYGYAFEGGIYWIQGTNPTTWVSQFANIAQNMLDLKISDPVLIFKNIQIFKDFDTNPTLA